MVKKVDSFLECFFQLEIVPGKKVRIPYWRNRLWEKGGAKIIGPFGGKGTPSQIRSAVLAQARKNGLDLKKMSAAEIGVLMKRKKIGLDCSGFAFQILNYLWPGFWRELKMAPGKSRNPIRRFNAEALTSDNNSVQVKKIADIQIGDLIPFSFRGEKVDHIAVVIEKTPNLIRYAHSSSLTRVDGPHLGVIEITDPQRSLKEQYWQEKLKDGKTLVRFLKLRTKLLNFRRIKTARHG